MSAWVGHGTTCGGADALVHYSGSPIAVYRKHMFKWLFPQEKATLHAA